MYSFLALSLKGGIAKEQKIDKHREKMEENEKLKAVK